MVVNEEPSRDDNWLKWFLHHRKQRHLHVRLGSGDRMLCPCCQMPTLKTRAGFDICGICFWEDDGQDDENADQVLGGPNHSYSLTEARANFAKYQTMYRPTDTRHFLRETQHDEEKKQLCQAFLAAMEKQLEADQLWEQAFRMEDQFERLLKEPLCVKNPE